MANDHLYNLLYQMTPHPEGVKKENIPKGFGACDAMLMMSIIYPADGSLSVQIMSTDGRKNGAELELEDSEMWKMWVMLAHRLSNSKTLSPNKRELASTLFSIVQEAILKNR